MRKKLIAGNWKMNGSLQANQVLIEGIAKAWAAKNKGQAACEVLVCVSSAYFGQISTLVTGFIDVVAIKIGSQDISAHAKGAYTGELSGAMLAEFGVSHAIVGHSERRQYHLESDAVVAAKTLAALDAGITPIVCVGESLQERQTEQTLAVVSRQLQAVLDAVADRASRIVVAYEPVWAIGTGLTATPQQAQSVHAALRSQLAKVGGEHVTILYGGSMNAANAAELLSQSDIDGGLIGGASLKSDDFVQIIAAAS